MVNLSHLSHESNTTEGAGVNKTSGAVEQGSFKDFGESKILRQSLTHLYNIKSISEKFILFFK